jgi:hypothetical protein
MREPGTRAPNARQVRAGRCSARRRGGRQGPSPPEDFVGNPAYGIQHLRDDLDRFVFLLGGSDEEQFLTGDHDESGEGGTNDN